MMLDMSILQTAAEHTNSTPVWILPTLTAAGAIVGLVLGYGLRMREWRNQTRLEIYDEYLRSVDRWRHASALYVGARRAHAAQADRSNAITLAAIRESAGEAEAAKVANLQAHHRVRLVGTRRVRDCLDAVLGAGVILARMAVDGVPPEMFKQAGEDITVATEAFIYAGSRDLVGWRTARRKKPGDA